MAFSSGVLGILSLFFCVYACGGAGTTDHRIAVIRADQYWAFQTISGALQYSSSTDGKDWGKWVAVDGTDTPSLVSNPVAVLDGKGAVLVFVQASDGQGYAFSKTGSNTFASSRVNNDIPRDKDPGDFSVDGIKAISAGNFTHVFIRSQSNNSMIYYGYQDLSSGKWSRFAHIGDDKNFLLYDFDVVLNTFLMRVEAFAVMKDGVVRETWQTSHTEFHDSWHALVLIGSPKFYSTPAVHTMGHSVFNGVVELFIKSDNVLHHIHQTTCDKVNNPWGPCTWELTYHKLGGAMPSQSSSPNPLTVTNNIHDGVEVFVIGSKDGHLYHIWQSDRGGDWSDWEEVGGFVSGGSFASLPAIVHDPFGWWQAYGLSTDDGVVNQLVQTPLDITVSPSRVPYLSNVTVTWSIPPDEATHKDWIGVYPHGAINHKYIDFMYVGGTQNPRADPVPKGHVQFTATLPDGNYDYRYLVNKEFNSVLEGNAQVYGSTNDPEWVQLYRGIARGLGNLATNLTACVKDGNTTIVTFKKSFEAFENREIVNGLHYFAEGLKDVGDTLVQCEETDIAHKLEKFIEDLVECTASKCTNFIIDIGFEIIILYERIYEIYGDILAATNSFGIDAYEMGGVCVGRVTWACLSLPNTK